MRGESAAEEARFNEATAFSRGKLPTGTTHSCEATPSFNEATAFSRGKPAGTLRDFTEDMLLQ